MPRVACHVQPFPPIVGNIANDFVALMHCLACVGFASVPLMAWRRGGGRHADPGFVR